jgi:methylisocitrate lyase
MERLRIARNLGADMGILEGVQSKGQARNAVKELSPWPMCYNSVENGVSPLISAAEAEQMGYRVIIFSFACLAPAYEAIKNTLEKLKATGLTGSCVSPMSIFEVCGLGESVAIDRAAGGHAFDKV